MRVLLTGGGTGGHIYPALAVARRLKEIDPNVEILYIGTERGLESTIVPKEGLPFKAIKIEGFKRSLNVESIKYNFKSVSLFLKSIQKAKDIIREFKPDVVLGTGGYVSAPICYAAAKKNIPTVVHEQNSFLGLTNKFLIRYIDRLAISFEDIFEQTGKYKEKVVFTGNPRAQEVVEMSENKQSDIYGLITTEPIILIFGGSRGAEKINESVINSYADLIDRGYQVIFVPGEIHYKKIVEKLNNISLLENHPQFVVKPYINEMIKVLKNTDIIISRSGATTIAEITALGIPSILIPSPHVTNDHQTKNAQSLVNNRAAKLLTEQELTEGALLQEIDYLVLDSEKRQIMKQNALKLGEPHATDELIRIMMTEIKNKQ